MRKGRKQTKRGRDWDDIFKVCKNGPSTNKKCYYFLGQYCLFHFATSLRAPSNEPSKTLSF